MEIIERKENPLLNRVEMSFRWEHSKEATPTLSDISNNSTLITFHLLPIVWPMPLGID